MRSSKTRRYRSGYTTGLGGASIRSHGGRNGAIGLGGALRRRGVASSRLGRALGERDGTSISLGGALGGRGGASSRLRVLGGRDGASVSLGGALRGRGRAGSGASIGWGTFVLGEAIEQ